MVDRLADGPHKSGQLARHSNRGLLWTFVAPHQTPVAAVESLRRLLGDPHHLRRQTGAALADGPPRTVGASIVPTRLHQHEAGVLVACLGDATTPLVSTTGVFACRY